MMIFQLFAEDDDVVQNFRWSIYVPDDVPKDDVDDACNTPILTSFALNVYDVYIVINHGVELKEKSPPSIYRFMFQQLKSLPKVYFVLVDTI